MSTVIPGSASSTGPPKAFRARGEHLVRIRAVEEVGQDQPARACARGDGTGLGCGQVDPRSVAIRAETSLAKEDVARLHERHQIVRNAAIAGVDKRRPVPG